MPSQQKKREGELENTVNTTGTAPLELTVEDFIELFRQKFGHLYVGKPATTVISALQKVMNEGEARGQFVVTNRDRFLTN